MRLRWPALVLLFGCGGSQYGHALYIELALESAAMRPIDELEIHILEEDWHRTFDEAIVGHELFDPVNREAGVYKLDGQGGTVEIVAMVWRGAEQVGGARDRVALPNKGTKRVSLTLSPRTMVDIDGLGDLAIAEDQGPPDGADLARSDDLAPPADLDTRCQEADLNCTGLREGECYRHFNGFDMDSNSEWIDCEPLNSLRAAISACARYQMSRDGGTCEPGTGSCVGKGCTVLSGWTNGMAPRRYWCQERKVLTDGCSDDDRMWQ